MIVCSFFTPRYREQAERLRASCEKFTQLCHIVEQAEAPSWIAGIHRKCMTILRTLLDHRQPVLWVDADCELLQPLWWHEGCDWAAYNWHEDPLNGPVDPSKVLHSGGVSFWGYTVPAVELLLRWREALRENPAAVDDQVLDAVINQSGIQLNRRTMKREMNWMTGLFGPPHADVFIRHDYDPARARAGVQQ